MEISERGMIMKDSFETDRKAEEKQEIPKFKSAVAISAMSPSRIRKSLYAKKDNGKRMMEIVQRFNNLTFKKDRFSDVAKFSKYFRNRTSFILGGLDLEWDFTRQEDGYLIPQVINKDYAYTVLDSDIGTLEYLQYRLPASIGITNCEVRETVGSRLDIASLSLACQERIDDYSLKLRSLGVDLVTGLQAKDYESLKSDMEIALKICKKGGTYIGGFRKDKSSDELSKIFTLIYEMSLNFKELGVYVPFLSDGNHIYIVASEFLGRDWRLGEVLGDGEIHPSEEFLKFLEGTVEGLERGVLNRDQVKYNYYKCLSVLNLF